MNSTVPHRDVKFLGPIVKRNGKRPQSSLNDSGLFIYSTVTRQNKDLVNDLSGRDQQCWPSIQLSTSMSSVMRISTPGMWSGAFRRLACPGMLRVPGGAFRGAERALDRSCSQRSSHRRIIVVEPEMPCYAGRAFRGAERAVETYCSQRSSHRRSA